MDTIKYNELLKTLNQEGHNIDVLKDTLKPNWWVLLSLLHLIAKILLITTETKK